MKVLFVGRTTYHFSYYETIIKELYENGCEITISYDEGWSSNQSDIALRDFINAHPSVDIVWYKRRSDKWRKILFPLRELRSFASYISRTEQSDFYLERWRKYLIPTFRRLSRIPFACNIIGSSLFGNFLQWVENKIAADETVVEFIQKYQPDVVVSSPVDMRFSEEIEYIKAAKQLNIPSVVLVLSWDNLTTKGLIHIHPTLLLAWNNVHATEANEIHGINEKSIAVVGSAFFDKWFNNEDLLIGRNDLLKLLGFNDDSKYILYLGSSTNIATDETWIVEEILDGLKNHPNEDIRNMKVIARPHPANFKKFERLEEMGVVIWPKKGCLPESFEAKKHFYNSVYHSNAVIGINTSGMIDATVMRKPCMTFISDKYKRTQLNAVHFNHLLNSESVECVYSGEDVANFIAKLESGDDLKESQRNSFIKRFVRPYGLEYSAASVASLAITTVANGARGDEVISVLESKFGKVD